MSNAKKHPDAWKFFVEQARNVEGTDVAHLGNYRIPVPDKSGNFIYAPDSGILWRRFIEAWYTLEGLNAPTVRGKVQHIVKNLNN